MGEQVPYTETVKNDRLLKASSAVKQSHRSGRACPSQQWETHFDLSDFRESEVKANKACPTLWAFQQLGCTTRVF